MADDALLTEMRALRDRVIGITDTALASRDGLIIRADTADLDPDNMAALAAASLGLAQRMAAEVGKGVLRQAMTRSSGGYIAVFAVGAKALLVVVGDVGLDVVRLDREAMAAVESIESLLEPSRPEGPARSARRAYPALAAGPASAGWLAAAWLAAAASSARIGAAEVTAWMPSTLAISMTSRISCAVAP